MKVLFTSALLLFCFLGSSQSHNGIYYEYFEHTPVNVAADFVNRPPVKKGIISTFSLSERNRDDMFQFRFRTHFWVDSTEQFTFYTNSDDGSMLYVDGNLVVDNDGGHGPQERSGSVVLSKGTHVIEVLYFDGVHGELLEVFYASANIPKGTIPANKLFVSEISTGVASENKVNPPYALNDMVQGVEYKKYQGCYGGSSIPDFSDLYPSNSGVRNNFVLAGSEIDGDCFSLQYEAYVRIDNAGYYTFSLNSRDDGKLYLNNIKIIDSRIGSSIVYLTTGFHLLQLDYFQKGGSNNLELEYEGPGIMRAPIPDAVLYYTPGNNLLHAYEGKIGINTQFPDHDLTVKGVIHAEEVKVDLQGALAPDYVFESGYNLRSIEDVRQYIEIQGHLPNIPSAEEMKREGINLKEMNLKLLEKIEELTLYTIQQQVEIETLKKNFKAMQKKSKISH